MDIYVVSDVWWRDGATVIGAGASLADAEAIADRRDRYGESPAFGSWDDWVADNDRPGVGRRDALLTDGTVHPSLSQEIVCVPLAGMVETGVLPPRLAGAVRDAAMRIPVDYEITTQDPQPPARIGLDRMQDLMTQLAKAPKPPGRLRVGNGAAWDYVQRALDRMTLYPADKALPGSIVARMMGIDIVLDPDLPPDTMRLGSKVYVISGDRMVAMDEHLLDLMQPLGRHITSPRD